MMMMNCSYIVRVDYFDCINCGNMDVDMDVVDNIDGVDNYVDVVVDTYGYGVD